MSTPLMCTLLGIILTALTIVGLVSYTNFYGIVPYDHITIGVALLFFLVGMAAIMVLEII